MTTKKYYFDKGIIHPLWKPCSKYEKCTKRQADYLDIFDTETQSIIPNPNDISKINNESM